jgi:hypothetical protein
MKVRRPLKITSRISSITNSFVQSIVPHIPATDGEVREALAILGMTPEAKTCVYCGAVATDWDHLRPLVSKQRPTGYVDDVRNRVPSCNRCNQSKSGSDWRKWMFGNAVGSPKRRGIPDLEERGRRLEEFEKWGAVQPLPVEELIDAVNWKAHWQNHDSIADKMRESQKLAEQMKAAIHKAYDPPKADHP